MKNIIILTGSELRHRFFRKVLASFTGINVLKSYCEGLDGTLKSIIESNSGKSKIELQHIRDRDNVEKDFFEAVDVHILDKSNPSDIKRGSINSEEIQNEILTLNPDLIISFGCSIIKEPLISFFKNRFVNIHLGLSPYYRGSGTNFWPLVNNEPEYVGVTFMHINAGVDTGKIIHQLRPRIFPYDGPHQIGNRLISDMTAICAKLIVNFGELVAMEQLELVSNEKYYRMNDFSEKATIKLYQNFKNGMISSFLEREDEILSLVPIIQNPLLIV